MAGKTPTQKIEELTNRVQDLEVALTKYQAVTDFALKTMEAQITDRTKVDDDLRNRVVDLTAKNAASEERLRTLEKLSDRSWQIWLAFIVTGLAVLAAFFKK